MDTNACCHLSITVAYAGYESRYMYNIYYKITDDLAKEGIYIYA